MADASTPPASPPTGPVTKARYQKLRATLESLFELDKADLDFGIYRLMAARNSEVQAFLDRQLKEVVRRELGHEAGADAARLAEQLDAEVARLAADGIDPEQSKTVQRLRKRRADSGTVEELEGRVYGHLSAFFGRYYDGGDFISQRRYGLDAYAIPYDGREVVLHWANKDQHYIKSGESHRNYAFRAGPDAKFQIKLTVVDAAAPRDNNKEAANAKRQHVLAADTDAVAIFGGKYATSTKGLKVQGRFKGPGPSAPRRHPHPRLSLRLAHEMEAGQELFIMWRLNARHKMFIIVPVLCFTVPAVLTWFLSWFARPAA